MMRSHQSWRGNYTVTTGQRALFLEHLAKTANVTASARKAGFDRKTAYAHRAADPEFAAEWEDALEQSIDDLEGEARRRAVDGVAEPVVSMGRVVEIVGDGFAPARDFPADGEFRVCYKQRLGQSAVSKNHPLLRPI